jgi:hypothetical protein
MSGKKNNQKYSIILKVNDLTLLQTSTVAMSGKQKKHKYSIILKVNDLTLQQTSTVATWPHLIIATA